MSTGRAEVVEGLERGLRVIEAFDESDLDMSLSEVARKAALTPATARRCLRTLAKLGYVQQAKGRYFLSARILSLGSAFLRSSNVESVLLPHLQDLVAQFGDSAGVAVRVDSNVLYLAHHFVPGSIRQVAGAGVSYPAHATSMGRALLAHLSTPELDQWLATASLVRRTEFTETDPERLRAILKAARADGYATIRDELFLGVTALAVPITNTAGTVVAALNTSAYSGRFTEAQLIEQRLQPLKATAQAISALIGRHPTLLSSLATAPAN